VLLDSPTLQAIVDGRISVVFRTWRRPTVKAGGTLRTRQGVLAIEAVDAINPDDVTAQDIERAGMQRCRCGGLRASNVFSTPPWCDELPRGSMRRGVLKHGTLLLTALVLSACSKSPSDDHGAAGSGSPGNAGSPAAGSGPSDGSDDTGMLGTPYDEAHGCVAGLACVANDVLGGACGAACNADAACQILSDSSAVCADGGCAVACEADVARSDCPTGTVCWSTGVCVVPGSLQQCTLPSSEDVTCADLCDDLGMHCTPNCEITTRDGIGTGAAAIYSQRTDDATSVECTEDAIAVIPGCFDRVKELAVIPIGQPAPPGDPDIGDVRTIQCCCR
jgi:hypothetical protein